MNNTMTYDAALAFIHTCKMRGGHKDGLAGMRRLLARLGNPERAFPSVHVAGTNGKGSVCCYAASALSACGYRVGLYTSPYLEVFNERVRVQGESIPNGELARLTGIVRDACAALVDAGHPHPSEFEVVTAIGFLYMQACKVDIAVVEVGLGGRLDPTNVLAPEVCAITAIGMDHMQYLGDTVEKIAGEKAGIIKRDTPVVLGAQRHGAAHDVLVRAAANQNAPLWDTAQGVYGNAVLSMRGTRFDYALRGHALRGVQLGMVGSYQVENAACALGVLWALTEKGWRIDADAVRAGLGKARWPGRLEWLDTPVPTLLDGAHNADGARQLCAYLEAFLAVKRVALVCAVMQDKAYEAMVDMLAPRAARAYCACVMPPRGLPADTLAARFAAHGCPAQACASVREALARAQRADVDALVVCGSLYLVGEARTLLRRMFS
nr:folylpolyglutamate synthase/dihydrofolate synthase family protein [Maliibacterium massiliense]